MNFLIFLWDTLIFEFILFQLLASDLAHIRYFVASKSHKLPGPALRFEFLYPACTLCMVCSSCWTDEKQINSLLNIFSLQIFRLTEFVINIDNGVHLYLIPDSNLLTFVNTFPLRLWSEGLFQMCLWPPGAWLQGSSWGSSQVKMGDG